MSKNKLGQEPAFSHACASEKSHSIEYGMSKRFYAACAAMTGLIAASNEFEYESKMEAYIICKNAFDLADELLKQEAE